MRLGIAFLAGVLFAIGLPAALLAFGVFDWGATAQALPLEESLAPWARDRSVARRAPRGANPFAAGGAEALPRYREHCLPCHGAPGVAAAAFARGLVPAAPDLATSHVQGRSDGELFWITRHGLRATGMPALAAGSDADAWKLVAFLRRLPRLGDEDRRLLAEGAPR